MAKTTRRKKALPEGVMELLRAAQQAVTPSYRARVQRYGPEATRCLLGLYDRMIEEFGEKNS